MHTIFREISAVCVNITFFMRDSLNCCIFGLHVKEFLKNIHCISYRLFWNSMIYHLFQDLKFTESFL
ncbi:hypothetical protein Hanom_Chr04g00346251 [Helianthus anomalus]